VNLLGKTKVEQIAPDWNREAIQGRVNLLGKTRLERDDRRRNRRRSEQRDKTMPDKTMTESGMSESLTPNSCVTSQSSDQKHGGSGIEERGRGARLEIPCQPSVAAEPSATPLDNPTARMNLKADLPRDFTSDFDGNAGWSGPTHARGVPGGFLCADQEQRRR